MKRVWVATKYVMAFVVEESAKIFYVVWFAVYLICDKPISLALLGGCCCCFGVIYQSGSSSAWANKQKIHTAMINI